LEVCFHKCALYHYIEVLFYTLAGGDGALTLEELCGGLEEALEEQAEDWGFTAGRLYKL
jgi:hypothetical protein